MTWSGRPRRRVARLDRAVGFPSVAISARFGGQARGPRPRERLRWAGARSSSPSSTPAPTSAGPRRLWDAVDEAGRPGPGPTEVAARDTGGSGCVTAAGSGGTRAAAPPPASPAAVTTSRFRGQVLLTAAPALTTLCACSPVSSKRPRADSGSLRETRCCADHWYSRMPVAGGLGRWVGHCCQGA